jgi:hypothetical protein
LPSALLKNTIRAFWSHSSRLTQYRYQDDVDFKRMMDQLSRREKISLLDLPWERPFTIVDLRTYFDLELLVSFYQDMLSPCFKGRQDGARISVLFFAFPCVCERSAYRLSPRA